MIHALLKVPEGQITKSEQLSKAIDQLLDFGSIEEAEMLMTSHSEMLDHAGYNDKKSDCHLIFYISGYFERRHLKSNPCPACAATLSILPFQNMGNVNSSLTEKFDYGGLL